MNINFLIRLASPRKQASERMKAEIRFLWRWEGKRARRQDYGHPKLDWGNWRTNEETGSVHQKQTFTMACNIPASRNLFIPVNTQFTVKPSTAHQLVPKNTHFRSFIIAHVWSLIAVSTEREMKPRIEYLYSWCKIKLLCQVFQPSVDRKLSQNSWGHEFSDKF